MSPTINESIPASTTADIGSSAMASGAMAARIMGASDESGPSTSTLDGPKTAYPIRQATVV